MMQTLDGSSATLLHGVPARAELDADDVPLGAINIEVDGAGHRPGDDAESLRRWCVLLIPVRPGKQCQATWS
jgi:hypothetical protein